jgi:hypothetical protein
VKFMLTIVGPFEGSDELRTAESRTMTIGRIDPAELCRDVGSWAHDVAARMLSGATGQDVDVEDDEDDLPLHDVPRDVIPADGWEALIDAAA